MLDQVDRLIKEWVQNVLGDVQVTLESPPDEGEVGGDGRAESGVSLYLLECAPAPPPRGNGRPPLQVMLRYLVTTWAKEQEEAHRLLGDLLFAALDSQDYEVDLTAPAPGVWSALEARPQPSFTLVAQVKQERAEPPTKYVRLPLVVQAAPMVVLQGVVLGPGDMPISGARVEALGLNMTERTDSRGRFRFPSIPGGSRPLRLRVKVKGREMAVLVQQPLASEPVTVRFDKLDTGAGDQGPGTG